MAERRGRWAATALSVSAGLAGLGVAGWVAWRTGSGLGPALSLFPVKAHLAALLAFAVDLLCRGGRLSLLAGGLGSPLSLASGCRTQLVGEAAAAVTPSRSGSDPSRLLVLRGCGVPLPRGGTVLVAELLAEAAALLAVLLLLVLLLPRAALLSAGVLVYAGGCLAVAATAWVSGRIRPGPIPPGLWSALGVGIRRWRLLRVGLRHFRGALGDLRRLSPGRALGVVGVSVLRVTARLAVLPLLLLPVAPGLPLDSLLGWPFLLLYSAALLPPPGGGGSVEAAFAALLAPVIPQGLLAGSLLWWRIHTFHLGALLGGVLLLLPRLPWVRRRGSRSSNAVHATASPAR